MLMRTRSWTAPTAGAPPALAQPYGAAPLLGSLCSCRPRLKEESGHMKTGSTFVDFADAVR